MGVKRLIRTFKLISYKGDYMNPEEKEIDPVLRKIMEIPDDQELPEDILCDVMIRALESQQLLIRSSAVQQLVIIGKNNPALAIPKIIKALDPSIDYWTVRFGAVEALGEIANEATVKPLLEYLKSDSDLDFRAMVAKQLGEMRESAKAAGSGLIEALKSQESSEIRENAAHALGLIKVQNAVEALIEALKTESNNYATREMCWSLGELKDALAIPILINNLVNKDIETRGNAAEALGKIKDSKAIIPLIQASKDPEVSVQGKAILALKQFSGEQVISEVGKGTKGDILLAIQYLDEYLFNVNNEVVLKKIKETKEPLLEIYREKLTKIKSKLEENKIFVEENFMKLQKNTEEDLQKLLDHQLPPIENQISNISLYEFRKHKWLENELYFELGEINTLYRDAGIMISELRDNVLNLLRKKKDEVISESSILDQDTK